jgi:hypothetical protein
MTSTVQVLKIPSSTLPKDWQDLGAKKFNLSPATVKAIIGGKRKNPEVFKYMLELAENEKARREGEVKELKNRLASLSK